MLNETKLAMRITVDDYDVDLVRLIQAAGRDLKVSGINLGGVLSFSTTTTTTGTTVTDNCTVTDSLVITSIITYCRMMFGSPSDYEKLKESYDTQKAAMMTATGYGFPDETAQGGDAE